MKNFWLTPLNATTLLLADLHSIETRITFQWSLQLLPTPEGYARIEENHLQRPPRFYAP